MPFSPAGGWCFMRTPTYKNVLVEDEKLCSKEERTGESNNQQTRETLEFQVLQVSFSERFQKQNNASISPNCFWNWFVVLKRSISPLKSMTQCRSPQCQCWMWKQGGGPSSQSLISYRRCVGCRWRSDTKGKWLFPKNIFRKWRQFHSPAFILYTGTELKNWLKTGFILLLLKLKLIGEYWGQLWSPLKSL